MKNGFTLVELLGVIALLALITIIAVPSINAITKSIQNNMLEKKIMFIEEAASLKGEDELDTISSSTHHYNSYPCESITVASLVPEYLEKDNDVPCLSTNSGEVGCVVNPSEKDNYLDLYEVIIYYKNNRIYAKFDKDNNLTCN